MSVSDAVLCSATAHAFECGYAAAQANAPTERAAATGCTGAGDDPEKGAVCPDDAGWWSYGEWGWRRWSLFGRSLGGQAHEPNGCTSLDAVQAEGAS